MKFHRQDNKLASLAMVAAGAIFLLIPAYYNRYPLLNPDSGTYIASGFKIDTPFDRPITYGLLIRILSFNGLSLWTVVLAQAMMMSWLISLLTRLIFGEPYKGKALLLTAVLSVTSSVSWITSQVQPDLFTSAGFLCMFLILAGGQPRSTTISLYVLFFLCAAVHLSHPFLYCAALVCLLLFRRQFRDWGAGRAFLRRIAGLFVLAVVSIAIMGSALAKSRHVFFAASLIEKGVMQQYLAGNCRAKNYSLCAYKDSLPNTGDEFMWGGTSPLYKIGGWRDSKKELNTIAHDLLSDPEYLGQYAGASLRQAFLQLITCNIADGNAGFPDGSNVNNMIKTYIPHEIHMFNSCFQNDINLLQKLQDVNRFFASMVVFCLVMLVIYKPLTGNTRRLVIFSAIAITLNVLDCGALSVLNGRYGCKMIWLATLCGFVAIMAARSKKAPRPGYPRAEGDAG